MTVTSKEIIHRLLPILSAQAIGLASGVAGVWLVSRLVTPADYGAYGVFIAQATIGASVVYAGLLQFVSRHWQAAPDRFTLLRETLAAMGSKIPWLLIACAAATLLTAPRQWVLYASLLFACALLVTVAQLAQTALQAAREHWRDLGISAGLSVTRSFLPPLCYVTTGAGLTALLTAFLLHAGAGAALGAAALRRWRRGASLPPAIPMLSSVYSGPRFVALAAAGWILAGLNRWIVAWFFGVEQAGYFNLATNLGAVLPWMVGVVLLQYVQPQWFAADASDPAAREHLLRAVDRIVLLYVAVALAAAATVHACVPLLTGTLISPRYADASGFVFMAGASATAGSTGVFYHALLMAAKRERACSAVDLGGAACLIVGGVVSAMAGLAWFKSWLLFSPVVPWLVNRTLARRALSGR
ncbi:lipopolysaccharide biosynthesis protein [Opitutus terrae]|uniref:Polysaccharide biosynthesis protein n=1 Tax=Opitutus terrae (strain DSM 11246 / JCM 15787 / PB90-1) TaxID=452637 RepID=B1ZQ99_OPITP|nr:oligosaccharide flippase family protein [Opitutus terrae]ACB73579.1 polysaccharide biosynthesis protein [Opitutus terrae PB90-1]